MSRTYSACLAWSFESRSSGRTKRQATETAMGRSASPRPLRLPPSSIRQLFPGGPPDVPLLHPPHRQAVEERADQPVPGAVLGAAVDARVVAHLDLGHAEASDPEKRRIEAMHPPERIEVFHHLPAEGLERA